MKPGWLAKACRSFLKGDYLDRAADALEVLWHVEGQNDILLQDPLGLSQACYVPPRHPGAGIQHVPIIRSITVVAHHGQMAW